MYSCVGVQTKTLYLWLTPRLAIITLHQGCTVTVVCAYQKAKSSSETSLDHSNNTSNKNIHFEMILDVGIGEKRKETRFLI